MNNTLLRLTLLLILFASCQTGKVHCPKHKEVKLKRSKVSRHYANYLPRADNTPVYAVVDLEKLRSDQNQIHTIKTPQAADEWDCPKPGVRKRAIKQVNRQIKSNQRKLKQIEQGISSDSSSTIVSVHKD